MSTITSDDVEIPEKLDPPSPWREKRCPVKGRAFTCRDVRNHGNPLTAIVSIESHDGQYIHLSVSRPSSLPTYDDLKRAKSAFIGDGRQAVQVFPSEDEHRDVHPNCLHLWAKVDGLIVPESFGETVGPKGGGS